MLTRLIAHLVHLGADEGECRGQIMSIGVSAVTGQAERHCATVGHCSSTPRISPMICEWSKVVVVTVEGFVVGSFGYSGAH